MSTDKDSISLTRLLISDCKLKIIDSFLFFSSSKSYRYDNFKLSVLLIFSSLFLIIFSMSFYKTNFLFLFLFFLLFIFSFILLFIFFFLFF